MIYSTREKEGLILSYRVKWLKIGLNKSGTEINEVEKNISLLYRTASLRAPRIILVDSPLACLFSFSQLKKPGKTIKQAISTFKEESYWGVHRIINRYFEGKVQEGIYAALRVTTWDEVRDKIFKQLNEVSKP